jgi:glycogen debranching enzyme
VYYAAYLAIYEMADILKENGNDVYLKKAEQLKFNILKNFYNADEHKFSYVIDQYGKLHHYQEGLGNSFAILFGVIDEKEAAKVIENIHISDYGLASIYPEFAYFTPDKPGRHNNIVWPFINGFWSLACKKAGRNDIFYNELKNLASLAIDEDKGNGDFREIYNPYTGKPDGGWQLGSHWESCHHQTWSATAYIAMVLKGLAGMNFEKDGIYFTPYLPEGKGSIEIKDIHYRNAVLNIKISGSGASIKEFKVNGTTAGSYYLPADLSGTQNIEIVME